MIKEILPILQAMGCTKAEVGTYIALRNHPDGISVLLLSRKLDIPRPTLYTHLETLLQLGLAKKGLIARGAAFYPASKEELLDLIDQHIQQLKNSKDIIALTDTKNLDYNTSKPTFTIYEGPKVYERIFSDILRSRQETYWLWPIKKMLTTIPEKALADFHEERIKRKIWINVIWPHNGGVELEKHQSLGPKEESLALRRIKILPAPISLPAGYGIYGSKTTFINQGTEDYGFTINSVDLSKTFKSQFDHFWNISKKYSKK